MSVEVLLPYIFGCAMLIVIPLGIAALLHEVAHTRRAMQEKKKLLTEGLVEIDKVAQNFVTVRLDPKSKVFVLTVSRDGHNEMVLSAESPAEFRIQLEEVIKYLNSVLTGVRRI